MLNVASFVRYIDVDIHSIVQFYCMTEMLDVERFACCRHIRIMLLTDSTELIR